MFSLRLIFGGGGGMSLGEEVSFHRKSQRKTIDHSVQNYNLHLLHIWGRGGGGSCFNLDRKSTEFIKNIFIFSLKKSLLCTSSSLDHYSVKTITFPVFHVKWVINLRTAKCTIKDDLFIFSVRKVNKHSIWILLCFGTLFKSFLTLGSEFPRIIYTTTNNFLTGQENGYF